MAVKPIPDSYPTATPYLIINEADQAIKFYKKAFNASELIRLVDANDQIVHAEIKIGNSPIMIAQECSDTRFRSPRSLGGSPVTIMLYVDEVDTQFIQAIAAGAKVLRPVEDQFYGDRAGTLLDPFGHIWMLATHIEDVSFEEVNRRFYTLSNQPSAA